MKKNLNRRTFLDFLGKGVLGSAVLPTVFLNSCRTQKEGLAKATPTPPPPPPKPMTQKPMEFIKKLMPTAQDDLMLAEGLEYNVLIRWKDPISDKDYFGYNNDYTAFIPLDENTLDEGILWVNHEYISTLFVTGPMGFAAKTKLQVENEMYNVGGSIMKVKKNAEGIWEVVQNDPVNRRITAKTDLPFNWSEKIMGRSSGMGTLANCSGGVTPWGTILTCEENFDGFYADRDYATGGLLPIPNYGWNRYYDNPPEHYGWVVEIDPRTGKGQKHIALGRCAHECATIKELPDGRLVVYTGDDKPNECLYKFISSKVGSLSEGTLYVADTIAGKWLSLKYEDHKILQDTFKDQTEVLIRLREAAKLIGGTPLDRPEDIDIDPRTGNVLVSLTNNGTKYNFFGSIMKVEETDGKFDSLTFKSDTYLAGGEDTGFACPDNMAFDNAGNLWFTSDMSGSLMHKPPYTSFKNNGLFLVPRAGKQAGEILQIASAPTDAELTGPSFSPDGTTLFLSVQHPGERSISLTQLSSHWPDGGDSIPKSSVVTIQGPLLEHLMNLE